MLQVAVVVHVEVEVRGHERHFEGRERPVAAIRRGEPGDGRRQQEWVPARPRESEQGASVGRQVLEAAGAQELHVAAEHLAAHEVPEPIGCQQVAVRPGRAERGTDGDVEVDREAGAARHGCRQDQNRPVEELATPHPDHVDGHERHDHGAQHVVRQREAGDERDEHEVARTALLRPEQGTVEQQRHQQEVEGVDACGRGGRPHRRHRGEDHGERSRHHRPDAETTHDQDRDAQREADLHRRQEVRAVRHRADRQEAPQLAEEHGQRISGRMGDAELVRDGLHLRPVAEADAGQQREGVDGESDERDDDGARPGAQPPRVPGVSPRDASIEDRGSPERGWVSIDPSVASSPGKAAGS